MEFRFSERIKKSKKSFIREILKVTTDPGVISFAGGLPNPATFPVEEIRKAASQVLQQDGQNVLQYASTEGDFSLREYIANRYHKKGLNIHPNEILITNGSQQGLDLIGKVFLNKDDGVLFERPGYLGAIQAISSFEPIFYSVALHDDGIDTKALSEMLNQHRPKLFYTVPNFQNPSGITYTADNRRNVTKIIKKTETLLIEDDPYGELRFMGEDAPSMKTGLGDQAILLGSFSKIISPGMRMGWICANKGIMDKLIIAKQASDLHSNYFSQRVIYQYLKNNDIDQHILSIRKLYKAQRDCMVSMIEKHFPAKVKYTRPEGGMFLWVTLPQRCSSLDLFNLAIKENVAFVPGNPFFASEPCSNTLRLNYTNSNEDTIKIGISKLGNILKKYIYNC